MKKDTSDTVSFSVRVAQMEAAIVAACAQFSVPVPRIRWSNRMTAAVGLARRTELVFSHPLLHDAPLDFCLETALHETAHYIDFQQRGRSDHGAMWRGIMRQLGYPNPARCHTLDRSKVYRYAVRCGRCGQVLGEYAKRPTRTLRTKRSACCHAALHLSAATN